MLLRGAHAELGRHPAAAPLLVDVEGHGLARVALHPRQCQVARRRARRLQSSYVYVHEGVCMWYRLQSSYVYVYVHEGICMCYGHACKKYT